MQGKHSFKVVEQVVELPHLPEIRPECIDLGVSFDARDEAVSWINTRQRLFVNRGHDIVRDTWWAHCRYGDSSAHRWIIAPQAQ